MFEKLLRKTKQLVAGGFDSYSYWVSRYDSGGDSGPGSFGPLAKFKADYLNSFMHEFHIETAIEFGCGDGAQLELAEYPNYVGYDISLSAIKKCRRLFSDDDSKEFFIVQEYDGRTAELGLSIDVLFHLVEDHVFEEYMYQLFGAAEKFVVIYSSNHDAAVDANSRHVRHRRFTEWVERRLAADWRLIRTVDNEFPYNGDWRTSSFSSFFVYEKRLQN